MAKASRNGKPVTPLEARQARLAKRRATGGPVAHDQTVVQVEKAARQERVMELLSAGKTYREIGRLVGVSQVQVMRDIDDVMAATMTRTYASAERIRFEEDATLGELKQAMMPLAVGDLPARTERRVVGRKRKRVVVVPGAPHDPLDVAKIQGMAAQRLVNISARRAALFGADAPVKVAPTSPDGSRRYDDVDDAELERIAAGKRAVLAARGLLAAANGNGDGNGNA